MLWFAVKPYPGRRFHEKAMWWFAVWLLRRAGRAQMKTSPLVIIGGTRSQRPCINAQLTADGKWIPRTVIA